MLLYYVTFYSELYSLDALLFLVVHSFILSLYCETASLQLLVTHKQCMDDKTMHG